MISPDDSEGVALAKVMDLRIVIMSDCFGPGIGLVLAKVMEAAKEIRSDDKKRVKTGVKTHTIAPLRLWAGRLLAFLGAGDARREEPAAVVGGAVGGVQGSGVMVCGDGWGGQ